MTNPNYCVLALLVDRSGSMAQVREDAEGAVRFIVEEQKDVPGRCDVMLCDFSTDWSLVYSLRPVQDTPKYFLTPRGGTALLDAIAKTLIELGLQLEALPEGDRPGQVIVAIQTDGLENSSKHYTLEQVSNLITLQRDIYQWEILFLGADMDAVGVGTSMGMAAGASLSYDNNAAGTRAMSAAVSSYVTTTRNGGKAVLGEDATS